MTGIDSTLSVVVLNVNGLNVLNKRADLGQNRFLK